MTILRDTHQSASIMVPLGCRIRKLSLSLSFCCLLGACSGVPLAMQSADRHLVENAELLTGEAFGVSEHLQPPQADILYVDDQMRAFLQERVPEGLSNQQKIRWILQSLLIDGLQLEYDNFKTSTAQDTFITREGNCMSFTNLFIALAREAGLRVDYQEVEIPSTWASKDGSWLFNKHINALVRMPDWDQVVDFNMDDFDADYPRRRISDNAATARYHNNQGVHWMGEGDPSKAFLHIREALQRDPDTSYFWTNLGVLYKRQGEQELAERALLVAIDIDQEPAAVSNLARLYQKQGKLELAAAYEAQARSFRNKNPYYLYHSAGEAYREASYGEAKDLLRRAIMLHDGEHQFHRLLGLAYLQLGQIEDAQEQFRIGRGKAESIPDQERYNRKLKLLAGR
jgi:Flp pilus assembly protein TadD